MKAVEKALAAAGMSGENAALTARAFDAAHAAWQQMRPERRDPDGLFAPGRIEVLGKHTDYAGGASLTCAVERGFAGVFTARSDERLHVLDERGGQRTAGRLDPDLEVPFAGWANYPLTVARRIARNFEPPLRGMDFAFHSTLPPSAGLSSSSALMTAVFLALAQVNDLSSRREYRRDLHTTVDLAGFLGSVENGSAFGSLAGDRGVGTFGGSEDHAAILCSEPGRIGHFAFCPVRRLGSLPVPAGHVFVIAGSGVVAAKTGNARDHYNRASSLVSTLLQLWRDATGRADPTLQSAVHSSPTALDALRDVARRGGEADAAALADRLAHFRLENEELVPAAAQALARGDVGRFAEVAARSQEGAEQLLRNQVPETAALVRLAVASGAVAASAFGAGFGGSVWALCRAGDARSVLETWRAKYRETASRAVFAESVFFVTAAGPPATRIALPATLRKT